MLGSAQLVRQAVHDLFDVFGLAAGGDEEAVLGGDDDEILHTDEGHVLAGLGEDDVVEGVELGERAVVLIAMLVGLEVAADAGPVADVIPVEGGLDIENAGGVLHEGVVDGELGQLAELFFHGGVEVLGAAKLGDEVCQHGAVAAELAEDGGDGPDEHACVPKEIALADEVLGQIRVGLFTEAGDFPDGEVIQAADAGAATALDIAVAGAGPGGGDAHGDEAAAVFGGEGGIGEHALKLGMILNEVIRREHDHGGGGIAGDDPADGESDGRSGVALFGLGDDVFRWEILDQSTHGGLLLLVGQDEDVFLGHESVQTVDGELEQGLFAKELEELLGLGVATDGPEALAATAGQDEGITFFGFGLGHGLWVWDRASISRKAGYGQIPLW